jgi:hypothetical protein
MGTAPFEWWVVVGLAAALAGCAPDCDRSCRKLIGCGLDSPRTAFDECVQSCESEQGLLESWEDDVKLSAFAEERRCIASSTCEEIADGACYDPDLYPF